jgi:hypothetical protein
VAIRSVATAVAARLLYAGLARVVSGRPGWTRKNYRGAVVDLAGGAALSTTAVAAVLLDSRVESRLRVAGGLAGGAAAVAGALDDARGSGSARGFRGHLGALRRGEITTGAVKIAGIGIGGVAAGALAVDGPWSRRVAGGLLVAGSANLANLLDLRPGRSLKSALVALTPILLAGKGVSPGRRIGAAAAGASAGLLAPDLHERTMLGDAGANGLGALAGIAIAAGAPARRIYGALAAVVALTAASEVVSFSKVIDAWPPLRWFDRLGRVANGADA